MEKDEVLRAVRGVSMGCATPNCTSKTCASVWWPLRRELVLSSSNEFEDHEMEVHLSRMESEFRVLIDATHVHFTEATSQSD